MENQPYSLAADGCEEKDEEFHDASLEPPVGVTITTDGHWSSVFDDR